MPQKNSIAFDLISLCAPKIAIAVAETVTLDADRQLIKYSGDLFSQSVYDCLSFVRSFRYAYGCYECVLLFISTDKCL